MKKRIILIFLAILLAFPFPIGMAEPIEGDDDSTNDIEAETNPYGKVTSKDEVIYGRLTATGGLTDLYVVNMLDIEKPGTVIDYGNYSTVKNLTNLNEIERVTNAVQMEASKGWFYYQGNMEEEELPWNIEISYMLDGEEISPHDLPGKEGRLLINIKTSQNKQVNRVFYDYYTLQFSLTLDTDIISNIQAPDGTIANSGKKRQVSYTVMPDRDADLSLLADVVDFEMGGIEIAAIPLSMALDDLETDEMTKELRTLSDAIKEINNGVFDLLTGVSELNDGVHRLSDGSGEFHAGMMEISNASSDIIDASETIDDSLAMINDELGSASLDLDIDDIHELLEGFFQFDGNIEDIVADLTDFNKEVSEAFSQLEDTLNRIPEPPETFDEDMERLYETGIARETLDHLLQVHHTAQEARRALDEMNEAFENIDRTTEDSINSVNDLNRQLAALEDIMSGGIDSFEGLEAFEELIDGIAILSESYSEFHAGLVTYTDGVSELTSAYKEIDSGINDLADGTSELESGVGELYDGTNELATETSDLPEQLQKEIDAIMDEFDLSDFEPISFVSQLNTNVGTVQFVLRTEAIEIDDEETNTEEEEEKPSFWERLMNLF
ncbi:YhgE/Pip domain-containing protein [Evansella tamaricis]|uniref:YhgE/Pip domain-containing protein n=1 Tax=Evansella tamaricis TaxID=2069301 RepID=A0ABS6JF61_9BACI|nr:YhgE/Pip domain-containing protein [Evansella tamaricis]MBU9712309.1 YhgE/Pip domain-containing protein [Evansella tamaricis]